MSDSEPITVDPEPIDSKIMQYVLKHMSAIQRLKHSLSYPELKEIGNQIPLKFTTVSLTGFSIILDEHAFKFYPNHPNSEIPQEVGTEVYLPSESEDDPRILWNLNPKDFTINQVIRKLFEGTVHPGNPILVEDELTIFGNIPEYPDWFKLKTANLEVRGLFEDFETRGARIVANDLETEPLGQMSVYLAESETSDLRHPLLRTARSLIVSLTISNFEGVQRFLTTTLPTLANNRISLRTSDFHVTNDHVLLIVQNWIRFGRPSDTYLHITRGWTPGLELKIAQNTVVSRGFMREWYERGVYHRPCLIINMPNQCKLFMYGYKMKDIGSWRPRKQKLIIMRVVATD